MSREHVVFIAGLPKSGTTWLEKMLADIPGYSSYLPPHTSIQDHNLYPDTFTPIRGTRVVVKMHTRGTRENVAILKKHKIKYCIMYRDLRDVAVSWYFYLKNVAINHPLHEIVATMDVDEGVDYFIDNDNGSDSLYLYMQWLNMWFNNRYSNNSMLIKYEDMLVDTRKEFKNILDFYEINISDDVVDTIVEKHRFINSTNRSPGEQDVSSFNRKGIAGDWKNYFSASHVEKFKNIAGQFLIDTGYEMDTNW